MSGAPSLPAPGAARFALGFNMADNIYPAGAGAAAAAADAETRNVPPNSYEAEQAVLGGLLLDNSAISLLPAIEPDDFYRLEHRLIFDSIRRLAQKGSPMDTVTVGDDLDSAGALNDAGGREYLLKILQDTPSAANIERYAQLVIEKSLVRRLIEAANEIMRAAYNPQGRDAKEILDYAEDRIFQIAQSRRVNTEGFKRVDDIIMGFWDSLSQMVDANQYGNAAGQINGLSTGYVDLDRRTSGLQKSDLIVIAGRPGMGKTTFAMNIAQNVALRLQGEAVGVFSMEMSKEQLVYRMLSAMSEIEMDKIRKGALDSAEKWSELTVQMGKLCEARLYIDDSALLTPLEVRARARRLASQVAKEGGKLSLLVIDYMQLMKGSIRTDNRVAEIGEISRSLKQLAKELDIPIIVLSQLSRKAESREDKRPILSDLRDSGAIEQDADLIVFMYRESYYAKEGSDQAASSAAQAIIAKHRNGATGEVNLIFQGQYSRFLNYADSSSYGEAR